MNKSQRARREAKGWRFGTVVEFLDLPFDDAVYIEVKLALSQQVRAYWQSKQLTQDQMAGLLGCSPSLVSKIETGDASVSLDLLIRALIALGATRNDLGRIIAA